MAGALLFDAMKPELVWRAQGHVIEIIGDNGERDPFRLANSTFPRKEMLGVWNADGPSWALC